MNEEQTFDNVLAQKFNTLSLLRFAFPTIAMMIFILQLTLYVPLLTLQLGLGLCLLPEEMQLSPAKWAAAW